MDPKAFRASLLTRKVVGFFETPPVPLPMQPATGFSSSPRELCGLKDLFQAYGTKDSTAAKISELGFTVSTLLFMKDEELEDMMNSLSNLLFGEKYGIIAAVRAQRRKLEYVCLRRRGYFVPNNTLQAAFSQQGLSKGPVQQKDATGSGGGGLWEAVVMIRKKEQQQKHGKWLRKVVDLENDDGDANEDDDCEYERRRDYKFIVTEPGKLARGKQSGLDYLFHLYDLCCEFFIIIQNIAKERGERCPTKVSNQVYKHAAKVGAGYINKPKMRHYVHCYALHCLDEEASNSLRRSCKERGESVAGWREACYQPLVAIAARQDWDMDAIFYAHPRLNMWYVPTKASSTLPWSAQ